MTHATFNQVKRFLVKDQTLSKEIQIHILDCPLCSEVKDLTARLSFKTCEKTKEQFEALYRDTIRDAEKGAFFKAHINACPHCREDYSKAKARFAVKDLCAKIHATFVGFLEVISSSGQAAPQLQAAGLVTRGGTGLTLMGAEAGQESPSEVIANEKYRVHVQFHVATNQLSVSVSGNDVKTNIAGITVALLTNDGDKIKTIGEAKTDRRGETSLTLPEGMAKGEYAIAIRE